MKLDQEKKDALRGLISDLWKDFEEIPPEDVSRRRMMRERITQLEAQLEAEDVDETVIGECCNEIESLLENMTANVVKSGWFQKISALFGV